MSHGRGGGQPVAFDLPGGSTGVLLIHGFTGSPPEMLRLGQYFNQRGMTAVGPLLAGHGTTPDDLNKRRWQEWTAQVGQALAELRARCETVFVGGLSMGSLLTLYLASEHPDISGILVYSPPLRVQNRLFDLVPIGKHLIAAFPKGTDSDLADPEAEQWLWHYDVWPAHAADELRKLTKVVEQRLPQIACPTLIVHSLGDGAIAADSAQLTYDRLGSPDKELFTLSGCGHCLTVDAQWQDVAERSWRWMELHRQ
ncbi:MAG: alpha/beta fold hydrolase [Caldilineales bacterium]|nr:alpha/beta fold hydrolase [Caldilineales bacterium]